MSIFRKFSGKRSSWKRRLSRMRLFISRGPSAARSGSGLRREWERRAEFFCKGFWGPGPPKAFYLKSANFLGAAVQPLGDDHISPLSAALAGKKNLLPNGPPNQKQEIWRKGSEFLASHLPPWVWNLPMAGKSHLFYNSPSPSPSLPFPCISLPLPSL